MNFEQVVASREIKRELAVRPDAGFWVGALGFIVALFFLSGCNTRPLTDPIIGPGFSATNAFRRTEILPPTLRRVAVLPLSYDASDPTAMNGQQMLEPMLRAELTKTERFELVFIKPEQLRIWTGKERWDSFEALPPDLLKLVAQKTACDGLLLPRLSQFKAYPPMLIGWRIKLAANNADVLWAVDELFDAAEETVSNSARRYDRSHVKNNPVLEDSRSILLSPSKFGQYTLHSVLETLPSR
jgi:hypothetical protein